MAADMCYFKHIHIVQTLQPKGVTLQLQLHSFLLSLSLLNYLLYLHAI